MEEPLEVQMEVPLGAWTEERQVVRTEAPVCLCLAARNRFLGLNLRIPEDVALLLNFCGRPVPAGLSCP
ncbi:unnamed protein product [Spirodela intermedia]|uniref:Hydrophobic seed protein domain-containing protein n=1 Tax=Spirodela intermedia TaxID=51605 RepID=A0A7I8IJE2_SPIIN|nr:unnamed protein product [Spirodela intermedia]CAA6658009.1 unnamed protein product [Spirodela intermedia]